MKKGALDKLLGDVGRHAKKIARAAGESAGDLRNVAAGAQAAAGMLDAVREGAEAVAGEGGIAKLLGGALAIGVEALSGAAPRRSSEGIRVKAQRRATSGGPGPVYDAEVEVLPPRGGSR